MKRLLMLAIISSLCFAGYMFPLEEPVYNVGKIVCTSWYSKLRTENGRTYQYQALNYPCKYGSTIVSPADGTVVYTQIDGYEGALITIRFDDGMEFTACHLSKYLVLDGERVYKGQPIARAGKSGRTTGVHVRIRFDKNGVRQFCSSKTWDMEFNAFEYVQNQFCANKTMMYK